MLDTAKDGFRNKPPADPINSATDTPKLHKLTRFDRHDIVTVNRSQLNFATYNPHEPTAQSQIELRKSIQDEGFLEHPVWNSSTGNLIAGHKRVAELDRLEGHQNYSLRVLKLEITDPRREKALNIKLNSPNLRGQYKVDSLLEMLHNDEFDIDFSGFRLPDFEIMGLDAGLDTDWIEERLSPMTPEARETLSDIQSDINSVLDQSDELKRRAKEDAAINAGKGNSGVKSPAPAVKPKPRQQSQDEDDSDGDENENEADEGETSGGDSASPSRTSSASPSTPSLAAQSDTAQFFRDAKRNGMTALAAQRETGFSLILTFPATVQKEAFCDCIGVDPASVHVDGPLIAEMMGLKLPAIPETRNPKRDPNSDKNYEESDSKDPESPKIDDAANT